MEQNKGRPQTIKVRLSKRDRREIEQLLSNGAQQSHRCCQRARALLYMAEGRGMTELSSQVGMSVSTAQAIRKRFLNGGLDEALHDRPRSGQPRKLRKEDEQRIVAIACTDPPPGQARWTVRLLAQEAVRRGIVKSISHGTIHLLLQSHDLKPWREKNVVRR